MGKSLVLVELGVSKQFTREAGVQNRTDKVGDSSFRLPFKTTRIWYPKQKTHPNHAEQSKPLIKDRILLSGGNRFCTNNASPLAATDAEQRLWKDLIGEGQWGGGFLPYFLRVKLWGQSNGLDQLLLGILSRYLFFAPFA